ncbi:nematocyst expressed protein 3-like [Prorops nasuta]|uniref:nematocyst expressed protein 3-like n=1 Tax=Prorops nasuta TaxID=863751 RepID=UPI0034CDD474
MSEGSAKKMRTSKHKSDSSKINTRRSRTPSRGREFPPLPSPKNSTSATTGSRKGPKKVSPPLPSTRWVKWVPPPPPPQAIADAAAPPPQAASAPPPQAASAPPPQAAAAPPPQAAAAPPPQVAAAPPPQAASAPPPQAAAEPGPSRTKNPEEKEKARLKRQKYRQGRSKRLAAAAAAAGAAEKKSRRAKKTSNVAVIRKTSRRYVCPSSINAE